MKISHVRKFGFSDMQEYDFLGVGIVVPSNFLEVKVRGLVFSSFFLSSSNFQLVAFRCLHLTKFSIPFVWMLTVSLVVGYLN